MHTVLKVTTVGNSLGVILPRELLDRLRVGKGDRLIVLETPAGLTLTAYDPAFAAQLDAAEQVLRQHRDALAQLKD